MENRPTQTWVRRQSIQRYVTRSVTHCLTKEKVACAFTSSYPDAFFKIRMILGRQCRVSQLLSSRRVATSPASSTGTFLCRTSSVTSRSPSLIRYGSLFFSDANLMADLLVEVVRVARAASVLGDTSRITVLSCSMDGPYWYYIR